MLATLKDGQISKLCLKLADCRPHHVNFSIEHFEVAAIRSLGLESR
jgi:hypothetical protein